MVATPSNLPVPLTSFVGRAGELAAVRALLTRERLLTLTGAGGSGKTRLAAQVADGWPDRVWWVELGALTDPALVVEAVAEAGGVLVERSRGPLRSLIAQLHDRRLLLCLDNCEHLLDPVGEVATALLRTCPEISILATSREPLGLPGEAVWRVPPLAADEAVALFVERARLARPGFALGPSNEDDVRRLCARLDGMPLALELAAGWLRALSPGQIEAGLDDRFALLSRGPRGVPARQGTLAASIDWSHDLLGDANRRVFRRLAVFAGGFALDAAQAACGPEDVLSALGRLVDKSLVVAEERGGQARYRLLETIREYAAVRLEEAGERDAVRERHLDHFLAVVEAAEPELDRDKDAWRARLEPDEDNLRAALERGLAAADPGRGRRLAAGLAWLWQLNGHGQEGMAYLRRAVERAPDDRSPLQARLLTGIALVADTAAPLDLEYDAAQRALELATEAGDERLRSLALALAAVGQFYTDFDAAWELSLEAQACAEAAGDGFGVDGAYALRGIILHLRDDHAGADALLERALAGLLPRGDRGVAATVVGFRASGALGTGAVERGRELARRAVELARPLGDYHRVGSSRSVLALAEGIAGEIDAGLRELEPVLRLVEGARDEVFMPGLGRVLGTLHLWRGDPAAALPWLEPESRSSDRGAPTYLAAQALPPLGAALRLLGRDEEAAAALERAVELARALGMPRVLADAREQQGHLDGGPDAHHEALALRMEHGLRAGALDSLDALARSTAAEQGARLLAASGAAREELVYPRRPAELAAHEALRAELEAELGPERFAAEWAAGAALSLDEAVAYARRARGSRRRPPGGWDSLTSAEREVVELAVEGLSNPQIGERLFMSRGTVKTHLSHVYAKLGVANRTELARLATSERPG